VGGQEWVKGGGDGGGSEKVIGRGFVFGAGLRGPQALGLGSVGFGAGCLGGAPHRGGGGGVVWGRGFRGPHSQNPERGPWRTMKAGNLLGKGPLGFVEARGSSRQRGGGGGGDPALFGLQGEFWLFLAGFVRGGDGGKRGGRGGDGGGPRERGGPGGPGRWFRFWAFPVGGAREVEKGGRVGGAKKGGRGAPGGAVLRCAETGRAKKTSWGSWGAGGAGAGKGGGGLRRDERGYNPWGRPPALDPTFFLGGGAHSGFGPVGGPPGGEGDPFRASFLGDSLRFFVREEGWTAGGAPGKGKTAGKALGPGTGFLLIWLFSWGPGGGPREPVTLTAGAHWL